MSMTARQWLRANGYSDVAAMIDVIVAKWKAAGKKTRRNWWEVLAGNRHGQSRVIGGQVFPVLASAQEHQGVAITPNAIRRSPHEEVPGKVYNGKSRRLPNNA